MRIHRKVSEKLRPLYVEQARYYAIYGGRGSGKSWGVADYLLLQGTMQPLRILCAREVQKSLRDSVHRLLTDRTQALGLGQFYEVLDNEIRGQNGTLFVFSGLASHTVESIKSFEGIDICWVEEAQSVSLRSLDVLIPTIRKAGSKIIFTFNPYLPSDPVWTRFVDKPSADCVSISINYVDNPFLSTELLAEAERQKAEDFEKYENIWLGKPKTIADGAIYKAELEAARSQQRICKVPYDANLPVFTGWDLGILDSTAIWFAQVYGREVRLIDYYEADGEPLSHYARIIAERGYNYVGGKNFLPHDVAARDLSSGVSRQQTLETLGLRVTVGARLGPEDRIEAARQLFNRIWIDETRCKRGIDCLQNYRRAFNDKLGEFKADPVHDWSSHAADAFGELALAVQSMSNPRPATKTRFRNKTV